MGRKITKLSETKKHLTDEQKAQKQQAEQALTEYTELDDKPDSTLEGRALDEWNRIVPLLKADTPVSELDRAMITNYCQLVSTIAEASDNINEHGAVITTATGTVKANPAVNVRSQAIRDMKQTASELGLSINSRYKLELNKQQDKDSSDPYEQMLK